MISRNNALTAATLATGAALASLPAMAGTTATNRAATQTDRATMSDSASKTDLAKVPNSSWVGLQVVSSDGRVIGTVSKIVAQAGNADRPMLVVRAPLDAQVFSIPAGLATRKGSVVELAATSAQLQKRPDARRPS